jgi:hypothetical protein
VPLSGRSAFRFLAVTAGLFGLCRTWPALVLAPPAWMGWLRGPLVGLDLSTPPAISASSIWFTTPAQRFALEDPYLLGGIPLYVGLWMLPRRADQFPFVRCLAGLAVVLGCAAVALCLVASALGRGEIGSSGIQPLELLALLSVAGTQISPIAAWSLLDPGGVQAFFRRPAPEANPHSVTKIPFHST